MRRRIVRAGAALGLAAGFVTGCQSSPPRTPYADNPLLQTRQPLLQTNPGTDRPSQVAQAGPRTAAPPPGFAGTTSTWTQQPLTQTAAADPQPEPAPAVTAYTPPLPPLPDAGPALPDPAAAPAALTAAVPAPATTPDTALAAPAPPAPGVPPAPSAVMAVAAAVPAAAAVPTSPAPAAARTINGKYGCAADHTWLQGELDHHYRGYLELRYRAPSEEDAYGGKVRLENDPRLAEFRAGDVVAVEGELVRDAEGGEPQAWGQYPRFHIRSIQLVERK
jgi:hypothetical protein